MDPSELHHHADADSFVCETDARDESPRSSRNHHGLTFGDVEQSPPEGPHVALSDTLFGTTPSNRPLTVQEMQSSPPRNSEYDATQNPGYPTPSPYDCNVRYTNPDHYPQSYRPPGCNNAVSRDAHATIPFFGHSAESSRFTNFNSSLDPRLPSNVIHPHGNLPPQFSQPLLPGGYSSTGPFQPVNYPPYSHLQAYYPPPVAFTSYPAAPYYQPHFSETDREASWPYQAAQQSDVTAGYQHHYPVPYLTYSQTNPLPANPLPTSVSSPPKNPLNSPISPCIPSHEQRLDTEPGRGGKESMVRRSYHPNPPAYSLQWVMWVGNVPADATYDELWCFFTAFPEGTQDAPAQSGVVSIFPISRTSCAFVNYDAEDNVNAAIKHFNGRPLRPGDPRCPKLVCRIRRTDDDLKAGVGGQRGMGLHVRWIKEHAVKDAAALDVLPKISISRSADPNTSTIATPSTTSSLLARFFPQRYFILKSLSQFDLDLSKEEGLWATQKHNEGVLNQAFRTSRDVYLIFSVNKSGEFYGYAKMIGSSSSFLRKDEQDFGLNAPGKGTQHNCFFSPSPNRQVDGSPLPMEFDISKHDVSLFSPIHNALSAPAKLGTVHENMAMEPSSASHSNDHHLFFPSVRIALERFKLDPMGPVRALRSNPGRDRELAVALGDGDERRGRDQGMSGGAEAGKTSRGWGGSFKIQWLSTEKVSFQKTKNIRNPWNHDREVKVSRDGTELEPGVGHRLVEQWAALAKRR